MNKEAQPLSSSVRPRVTGYYKGTPLDIKVRPSREKIDNKSKKEYLKKENTELPPPPSPNVRMTRGSKYVKENAAVLKSKQALKTKKIVPKSISIEVDKKKTKPLRLKKALLTNLRKVNAGKPVKACIYGKTVYITKSKPEIRRHYLKTVVLNPDHKIHSNDIETFVQIFKQIASTTLEWKDLEVEEDELDCDLAPPKFNVDEVSKLLKINTSMLKTLHVHPNLEKMLICLKKLQCHFNLVDVCKIMAYSKWQQGDIDNCAYLLSESHGVKFKYETIHRNFKQTEEEFHRKYMETLTADEKQSKDKILCKRIKDSQEFGKDMKSFYSDIEGFNPNWNIIQITTGLHTKRRFGQDYVNNEYTPSIFLTNFNRVPHTKRRSTFVMHLPPPIENGVPCDIVSRFNYIMRKNKQNSSHTNNISRADHWNRRRSHNQALQELTFSMQKWIGFWKFLFPGNIKSSTIQDQIKKTLKDIVDISSVKLDKHQVLLMYKLIENFQIMPSGFVRIMSHYVKPLLGVNDEIVESIIHKIISCKFNLDNSTPRHSTILILDQMIESLPWECMECLSTTDVTRMPSMGAIKSLMNSTKIIHPKYPSVAHKNDCTYVLNSDGSLKKTQERLEEYLKSRPTWNAIVAREPTLIEAQQILKRKDIILYCGHGWGATVFPDFVINKLICEATPLIMGCSSVRPRYLQHRCFSKYVVNSYMSASCTSMVGFLWDITDTDCDRVTVDLLERWAPGPKGPPAITMFDHTTKRKKEKCLATAVRLCRSSAVNFLTGAAVVNYGLPIHSTD